MCSAVLAFVSSEAGVTGGLVCALVADFCVDEAGVGDVISGLLVLSVVVAVLVAVLVAIVVVVVVAVVVSVSDSDLLMIAGAVAGTSDMAEGLALRLSASGCESKAVDEGVVVVADGLASSFGCLFSTARTKVASSVAIGLIF